MMKERWNMSERYKIYETVFNFSRDTGIDRRLFVVSDDAALAIGKDGYKGGECKDILLEYMAGDIRGIHEAVSRLYPCSYMGLKRHMAAGLLAPMAIIVRMDEGLLQITSPLTNYIEKRYYNDMAYRSISSVVDIKRRFRSPRDIQDIINLGYMP